MLWRFYIKLKSRKLSIFLVLYDIVLFVFLACLFRIIQPDVHITESSHFDQSVSFGTGMQQADSFLSSMRTDMSGRAVQDLDSFRYHNSGAEGVNFADECLQKFFYMVGLVDDSHSAEDEAQQIYQILESKMLANQSKLFQSRIFNSIEDLESYQTGY